MYFHLSHGLQRVIIAMNILLLNLTMINSISQFPVQRKEMHDLIVFWREPINPVGIVVLFHGCHHSGGDFFEPCEGCLGLPEELAISKYAVNNQHLVTIAITSSDHFTGCWGKEDIKKVKSVISTFQDRLQLTTLFGIGASSGGAFISRLAAHMTFTAISVQIMACSNTLFSSAIFPPIEFVTMPRDKFTEANVMKNVNTCEAKNIIYQKRACLPMSIDGEYLYTRSQGQISLDLSRKIHYVLMSKGFIDISGKLLEDPRESEWRMALERAHPYIEEIEDLSMVPDESAISEILNVAWAMHEFCSTEIERTFSFFRMESKRLQLE